MKYKRNTQFEHHKIDISLFLQFDTAGVLLSLTTECFKSNIISTIEVFHFLNSVIITSVCLDQPYIIAGN